MHPTHFVVGTHDTAFFVDRLPFEHVRVGPLQLGAVVGMRPVEPSHGARHDLRHRAAPDRFDGGVGVGNPLGGPIVDHECVGNVLGKVRGAPFDLDTSTFELGATRLRRGAVTLGPSQLGKIEHHAMALMRLRGDLQLEPDLGRGLAGQRSVQSHLYALPGADIRAGLTQGAQTEGGVVFGDQT